MRITRVVITPLKSWDGYIRATASIVLEENYAVNGIWVAEDSQGKVKIRFPFVPKKERKEKEARIFAFAPLNREARGEIEKAVIEAYQAQKIEVDRKKKIGYNGGSVRGLMGKERVR